MQFNKVLIVDDEIITLDIIEIILDRMGYEVTKASSGYQAIEILHSKNFDLVITDFHLGDTDGVAVLKKAKGLNPLTTVIILTSDHSFGSVSAAFRHGVDDYLPKPFTANELSEWVIKNIYKGMYRERMISNGPNISL